MIGVPPVAAGAVHDTTDEPLAAPVAATVGGASGAVAGVIEAEAIEATEVPDTLVAVTEKA